MPVVEVHVIEGYDAAEKSRLCRGLTDAVRQVIPAPVEAVTVMIHEMADGGYMRGREARTPAPALPDPVAVVRGFLEAMQARDLETARAALGPDFVMCFPGSAPMHQLEELLDWAAPRYQRVGKVFEGVDVSQTAGAATVVYCRGTLYGAWPDGTPFEGIRFVDRFELEGGRITRQDVWNDLGEVRR